ncbi:ribonuclease P protein subunit p29 [Pelomyxa schiedti]|nr:ribonuclease P protein subunit p29 [Pelomyxa schiedti]
MHKSPPVDAIITLVQKALKQIQTPENTLGTVAKPLPMLPARKLFPSKENRIVARALAQKSREKAVGLSAKKLRKCGVFDVPPECRVYSMYIPLHELWCQYIKDLIGILPDKPNPNSPLLLQHVVKADYHGALMKVIKSTSPCNVGIEGICIQETTNTFRLVTALNTLKVVPKQGNHFTLRLPGHFTVTLFGSQLCVRSSERSSKKWKAKSASDFFL